MGLFYDGNHKGATCRQVCPSSGVWKAGADIHQLLKWHVTQIPRQTLPSSYFCIFRSHCCHSDCRTLLLVVGGWSEESQWPEPEFVFTTHPGSLERVLFISENWYEAGSEGVSAEQQELVPTEWWRHRTPFLCWHHSSLVHISEWLWNGE